VTVEARGPVWLQGFAERWSLPIFNRVVSVRLQGAKVDDPMLESVAGLQHLRSLTLIDSRVTAQGLSHLAQLRHLEELTLVGAQVNDSLLGALSNCTRLRRVSLYRTATTNDGIARLERSLPELEISNRHPVPQAGS
jgi:hypothetical protein